MEPQPLRRGAETTKTEETELPPAHVLRFRQHGPIDIDRAARGLDRTQMIGRNESGLPITAEGLAISALMEENRLANERTELSI